MMTMSLSILMLLFILLILPMEARCHFLHYQVKRRTQNNNNSNHLTSSSQQTVKYNPRGHLSIPVAFLSIRGGSDEGDDIMAVKKHSVEHL